MTRHPIRSTGNPTVSFTGPPMSEARRQHIHGKLHSGPLTKPRMRRRNIAWAVLAVLLVLAFDHMMRADQARLCASDAAMMQGCGE